MVAPVMILSLPQAWAVYSNREPEAFPGDPIRIKLRGLCLPGEMNEVPSVAYLTGRLRLSR